MSTSPAAPPEAGRPVTQNACRMCTPLGACLVFRGIAGAVPFLHGSQGCATYIRRYLISHFREPVDIAASNFSEADTVFGGASSLTRGLENVRSQYQPRLIGVATTCLSETIGEDVPMMLREFRARAGADDPALVHVSTASYRGSHIDGFHAAVRAVVDTFARPTATHNHVAIFPGMVSPADLRHLRELAAAFGLEAIVLPDYADTLDAGNWEQYQRISEGGTTLEELNELGGCRSSFELGRTLTQRDTAAALLESRCGVLAHRLGLPIGIRETDQFTGALSAISGHPMPPDLARERSRLVDAYVDAHKYVFGARAAVFGEADLVIGLVSFLCEIGVEPVACLAGDRNRDFESALRAAYPDLPDGVLIEDNVDYERIGEAVAQRTPDFLIGPSKGYALARAVNKPLLRVGFPIHDRFGAQRLLHLGYRGTQQLFDRVVNLLLEQRQESSDVGWSYI